MSDTPQLLLAHHLKALKLPTFLREDDKLAQHCAAEGIDHPRYLLRLAELELDPSLWQPEFLGAPERQATGPNGETGAVTDNVIAVRRLPQ